MIEKHVDNIWSASFGSISEFFKFISESPENEAFMGKPLKSKERGRSAELFTSTRSFEEASDLLLNGWHDKAFELEKRLKAKRNDMAPVNTMEFTQSVAGFQPIVPLFLAGQPASMMSMRLSPRKQKVVTVCKSISYPGHVDAEEWTEQGVKALAIVTNLERNGYRCNIDIVRGGYAKASSGRQVGICCRVRVKHANERLNISKLAFPFCNPSMQRRMMFRFTETYNRVCSGFSFGYGKAFSAREFDPILDLKKEVLIPAELRGDADKAKSFEELRSAVRR